MDNHGTEKHDLIMRAAADLFAKQGYKKTTVDEIVAGAGISKGLFYHYFKNKQELYISLYTTYTTILSWEIGEKVDMTETDFFKRLKQIAYIRIDFVAHYPSLWKFLYSAYYEEHPDIAPLIKKENEGFLQRSYSGSASNIDWSKLKQGFSPDQAIELITWVAEGFVRKIAESSPSADSKLYYQFDEYLEILKNGMIEEGKR